MNIEELSKKEDDIQRSMTSGGHFDQRNEHLHENGLYRESANVFKAYVELAEAGNLEAIKRALFYTWYQISEPNSLSGIPQLDDVLVLKVLTIVDQMAKEGVLDEELKNMLPFYYLVACYYFERFDGLEDLKAASEPGDDIYTQVSNSFDYTNRGQMGYYWHTKGK